MKTFIGILLIGIFIVNSLFLAAFTGYDSQKRNNLQAQDYVFNNPAGCFVQAPSSIDDMLQNVHTLLGKNYDLLNRREYYIWNAFKGEFVNIQKDPFVREYIISYANMPLTYLADPVVSAFQASGFVVYLRNIDGQTRLLAIPMLDGVMDSIWSGYVSAYWQSAEPIIDNDFIIPVRKKLPCQWVVDAGYVQSDTLSELFNFDWQPPDYLSAGDKYLASDCPTTQATAESIVNSDGSIATNDGYMMCGPLAWAIMNDANSFPYQVGSWDGNPSGFVGTNPRFYATPWSQFDPQTFDLIRYSENINMNGFDFQKNGNLYPGDIIFSYGDAYYKENSSTFHHIFIITDISNDGTRYTISNLAKNTVSNSCTIEHIPTYTPGDLSTGFINYEWANNGYGETGNHCFDVFRWKWITYHIEGTARSYTIRIGDTLETIAFDWKISPTSIAEWNGFSTNTQLTPGQTITLPDLDESERYQ